MKVFKISIISKSAVFFLLIINGFAAAQTIDIRNSDPIGFATINKKNPTDGKKIKNIKGAVTITNNSPFSSHPIYIINDERIMNLDGVDASKIISMRVYKDKKAIQLYGEEAKNGVIVIEAEKDYLKKSEKDLSRDEEILAI